MADYWVIDRATGVAGRVSDESVEAFRKEGWAVYPYNGQDAGMSQTAGGGYVVDPAAAMARQEFLDNLQGIDRQTNQYGAVTNRYQAQTGAQAAFQNAATNRLGALGQFGQFLQSVRGPADYFQFSNNMHGQPNASGLSVLDMLAGHGANVGVGPLDQSKLKALTPEQLGLSGVADAVNGWGGSSSSATGGAASSLSAPQGAQAGQQAASTTQGASTGTTSATGDVSGTNTKAGQSTGGTRWDASQGDQRVIATSPNPALTAGGVRYDTGVPAGGRIHHRDQSAWEGDRDSLLGGMRHDDWQMAHSTTAQELNDVAKISDRAERQRQFNILAQRGPWTPATSHGSNWRDSGDEHGNPHRNADTTFDYNGGAGTRAVHKQKVNRNDEQAKGRRGREQDAYAARGGGTMRVVTHPTTVHLGEGGKDEALFAWPLERHDTQVPPALLALANSLSLDRDRQRGVGNHLAVGGGVAAVPADPSAMASLLAPAPDAAPAVAAVPIGPAASLGAPPQPPTGDMPPTGPQPDPRQMALIRMVLMTPPAPDDPPAVQAIRAQWTLDSSGQPVPLGGGQMPQAAMPMPMGDVPPHTHLATGGGIVYGSPYAAISGGSTVTSANSKPDSAGQVRVPSGKGKTKRIPATQAQIFPEPTRTSPYQRSLLGPSDWSLLASYLGAKGSTLDDWNFSAGQGLPAQSRIPLGVGFRAGAF